MEESATENWKVGQKEVYISMEPWGEYSGKTLFISKGESSSMGGDTSSNTNNGAQTAHAGAQQRPYMSMMGSGSPSSTALIIYKAYSVLIGFFSQEYLNALLEEVDGLDIFVFMIALLAIWKYVSDPARKWVMQSVYDGGLGWRDNLLNIIDFMSYLVVYVVFGYFGRVIFSHASDFGHNIEEITLIGFAAAIYAYDIYRFVRIEVACHS